MGGHGQEGLDIALALQALLQAKALKSATAVALAASTLVNLSWRISVHTAVNSGAVTILVLVFGPALIGLAPTVALVGWSRVEVNDRSPLQTVGGALLGAAVGAGTFLPLR